MTNSTPAHSTPLPNIIAQNDAGIVTLDGVLAWHISAYIVVKDRLFCKV